MKQTANYYKIILILITIGTKSFGQTEIYEFTKDSGESYFFNGLISISAETFFEDHREDLGLSLNDEMILRSEHLDELGYTHLKYKQYYKGLEVEAGSYILHTIDGKVIIANGRLISNLNLENEPSISEVEALTVALEEINAEQYAWQNESWEQELKIELSNETATYYPVGKMVFVRDSVAEFKAENYNLAYRFEIITSSPDEAYIIYINALDGNFIKKHSNTRSCTNHVGSATMMYYGYQTFNVKSGGGNYSLEDCSRGDGIVTKWHDCPGGNPLNCNITDGDGSWGTTDQKGTTIHWLAQEAWDYFETTYSLTGMDNSGCKLNMIADWHVDNSRYFNTLGIDKIKIGTWDSYYLARADVMGHEFTHGIIHYAIGSNGFDYASDESGGLEESFCDIFGEAVERYVTGSNDWLNGDPSNPFRSFLDPNDFDDPEYYGQSPYWTPDDAHSICSIQDRWFYLLAAGSTDYVTGIGFDKAAQIAYRTLTVYLNESDNFNDSRNWSIQSAKDLFGDCSNEVLMTTNAWAEVQIGSALPYIFCANLSGPTIICEEDPNASDYTFTATGTYNGLTNPTGMSFNWTISPSSPTWTTALSGAGNKTLTVTNISGTTDRTITVTATFAGNSKSTSRNVYIEPCEDCPPLCRFGSNLIDTVISINIFPNPTRNILNFEVFNTDYLYNIQICDMSGNILYNETLSAFSGNIDISQFPSGLFIFKLTDKNISIAKSVQLIK